MARPLALPAVGPCADAPGPARLVAAVAPARGSGTGADEAVHSSVKGARAAANTPATALKATASSISGHSSIGGNNRQSTCPFVTRYSSTQSARRSGLIAQLAERVRL